ncbi:LamG-like jellyroll fold domain-containing protein [Planctomycetota bacterium]
MAASTRRTRRPFPIFALLVAVGALLCAPRVTEAKLIAHLAFDDPTGSTVAADSAFNHNGALVNMNPSTDWVAGRVGGGLDLDGNLDHMRVNDASRLDFGSGDFSVSMWVNKRATNSGTWDNVWGVNKWNTGASPGTNEWTVSLGNPTDGDVPNFAIQSGTTTYAAPSTEQISLNAWHHLVGVRSGGTTRLYVDGDEKAINNSVGAAAVNNVGRDLYIAAAASGTANCTNMVVDELQIYDQALRPSQVRVLHDNPGSTIIDPVKVYWAWNNGGPGKVQRANPDGSGVQTVENYTSGYPAGVALDPSAGKVYYTLAGDHDVRRCDLDGGSTETLIAETGGWARGIELDIDAGKMYWAQSFSGSQGKLLRANLNGTGMQTLFDNADGLMDANDIALDLASGTLYCTDFMSRGTATDGMIYSGNMDGTGALSPISTGDDPRGLGLDLDAGKVYWTDFADNAGGAGRIRRANLNGTGIENVITGLSSPKGIALDLPNGLIYWSDASSGGSIRRASLSDGGDVQTIVTGIGIAASDVALLNAFVRGPWEAGGRLELIDPIRVGGAAYAMEDLDGDGAIEDHELVPVDWKLERRRTGLSSEWFLSRSSADWSGTPDYLLDAPTVARGSYSYPAEIMAGEGLNPGDDLSQFAVRYSGQIHADHTGNYAFQESVDDYARLYIDGQLIISDNTWNFDKSATVLLSEGWHDIEFLTWDGILGDKAYLNWDPAGGTAWEVVPSDVLGFWDILVQGSTSVGDRQTSVFFDDITINDAADWWQTLQFRLTVNYQNIDIQEYHLDVEAFVPEPATCLLIGGGLLALLRRRRKSGRRSLKSLASLLIVCALVSPALASPYSTFVIDETNPVIYWDLDGNATDLAPVPGGMNNGITTFQAGYGGTGPQPSAYPNMPLVNGALRIDGQNDTVIYNRVLDGFNNTGGAGIGSAAYSVQAWFNSSIPFTDKLVQYVLGRGDFQNETNYHGWSKDSVGIGGSYNPSNTNKLFFYDGDAGSKTSVAGTTILAPNTWYQTLLVRDGNDVKVYLNGAEEISATLPWAGGDGDLIAVGGRADYVNLGHLSLKGTVDEVAVWDRAVSHAEAQALYRSAAGYATWTDDFESGPGKWNVAASPGATMAIVPDPAQPDNALCMNSPRGTPGNRFDAYAVPSDPIFDAWIESKPYTVEFDLLVPDNDHHWFYAYVDERVYSTINTNGSLAYLTVGNPYTVVDVTGLTLDEWHSLRYEVVPAAAAFDLYVDGNFVHTGTFWDWEGGSMPADWWPFIIGDRPTRNDDWGEAYWDNFRMTFAVPEPATCLLVGGGLLALLRSRRKSRRRSLRSLAPLLIVCALVAPALASPYSDHVIDETSPVIYWDLNEGGGSTAYDLVPGVGGANDGAYVNSAAPGAAGPRASDGFLNMGAANTAASTVMNGAVEYTSLTTTAGVGTTAYSAQLWFNSSVAFNQQVLHYVLGRGNGRTPGTDLRDSIYIGGTHPPADEGVLYYINGKQEGPNAVKANGTRVLSPNTWYHLAFVRDSDDITIYLNGKPEIQTTAPWYSYVPSNPPGIGEHFTPPNRVDLHPTLGLTGRCDEVAVWDRPLSDTEVRRLYTEALSPYPYPRAVIADQPEAYWRLNETTGRNTAMDATGNGHDFTYHAAPSRTGLAPDVGPRPAAFGGFEPVNYAPTLIGGPLVTGNGYVGIPTGVLSGQNDYSIEMWVRPGTDVNPHSDYLLHRNDTASPTNRGDFLGVRSDGTTYGTLFIYDGMNPSISGTTVLDKDEWYHVALTRDGDYVTAYLNGQVEIPATLMAPTGTHTSGVWAFGGRLDLPRQQKFSGNIDEIAIYGSALDQSVFQAHWNAALPEPATCLLLAGGLLALARRRRPRAR